VLLVLLCFAGTGIQAQTVYDEGVKDTAVIINPADAYDQQDVAAPGEDSTEMEEATIGWNQRFDWIDTAAGKPLRPAALDTAGWNRLTKEEAFWYANYHQQKDGSHKGPGNMPVAKTDSLKTKQVQTNEDDNDWSPSKLSDNFRIFLWILMGAVFVGIIIAFLVSNNALFASRSKKIEQATSEEDLPEDITTVGFDQLVQKAKADGNYRLAIRWLFLQLLKDMNAKDLLQYSKDKTNMDYLMEIKETRHRTAFSKAAFYFDYAWFGHFEVNEDQYNQVESEIRSLTQTI
jgi:hypothetical protein